MNTPTHHMAEPRYTCSYCHRTFVREHMFMKHMCARKEREELSRSAIGVRAYQLYQKWMRSQGFIVPSQDTFKTSKLFTSFIKFVEFAKRVNLPLVDKFIAVMIKLGFPPSMWCREDVYARFIEYLDTKIPPVEHALSSTRLILRMCDRLEIDSSAFFDVVSVQDIIQLVSTRRLSPWLLMCSAKFGQMLTDKATDEQFEVLSSLIRFEQWDTKKRNDPKSTSDITRLVQQLGI